jgi:hypothetical protein
MKGRIAGSREARILYKWMLRFVTLPVELDFLHQCSEWNIPGKRETFPDTLENLLGDSAKRVRRSWVEL